MYYGVGGGFFGAVVKRERRGMKASVQWAEGLAGWDYWDGWGSWYANDSWHTGDLSFEGVLVLFDKPVSLSAGSLASRIRGGDRTAAVAEEVIRLVDESWREEKIPPEGKKISGFVLSTAYMASAKCNKI